jgi:hypothetical protein
VRDERLRNRRVADVLLRRGVCPDRGNLTIGGYLQPRYSLAQKDDDNPTPTQRLDISEFRVRRAKLVLTGFAFSKNLTYKLQAELTQGGSQRLLEDVWSNYKVVEELQLRAGQDKVPFSRQWLVSAWALSIYQIQLQLMFQASRAHRLALRGWPVVEIDGRLHRSCESSLARFGTGESSRRCPPGIGAAPGWPSSTGAPPRSRRPGPGTPGVDA